MRVCVFVCVTESVCVCPCVRLHAFCVSSRLCVFVSTVNTVCVVVWLCVCVCAIARLRYCVANVFSPVILVKQAGSALYVRLCQHLCPVFFSSRL